MRTHSRLQSCRQRLAPARAMALALTFAVSALVLAGCAGTTGGDGAACSPAQRVYAGSDAGALHALRLDACRGLLTSEGAVAEAPRPRWLLAHPQLPVLYVASDDGSRGGQVLAFQRRPGAAQLVPLNGTPAGGGSTTQLWLDLPSATLLAANFANGSTSSLALQPDGRLGALRSSVIGSGSGPHRRQNGPHAHGVALDPSGRWVLTADLGADRLFVRAYDRTSGRIDGDRASGGMAEDNASPPRSLALPPGSGPRHFVFAPDGGHVYLLNELSADITVLRWQAQEGRLTPVQTVPLSRPGFTGTKSGSGLVLSADGRHLYAGERGEHHVVVFGIDAATGRLTLLQHVPSGGEAPWALALQPQGHWLVVANQRSNHVQLFGVDRATGRLAPTAQAVDLPAPVSLAFVAD